jgi:catechol 2,3-dioxygenase-like lactoylglutathione lyase family enzyme
MLKRREFLKNAAACSFIAWAHPFCGQAGAISENEQSAVPPKKHRIEQIFLQCAVPLAEMKAFYHEKLGLPLAFESPEKITFRAGLSLLTFEKIEVAEDAAKPFYHFAFNIPENKILAALDWLQLRTPLVVTPPHLRDETMPSVVRHFRHWDAHSLFFWDPSDNIVEFIARHALKNAAPGAFAVDDILNISEIGYMVENQERHADWLNKETGLRAYPMGTKDRWAMGDEQGLVLCLPIGREFGDYPAGKSKSFSIFPTRSIVLAEKGEALRFEGYPYLLDIRRL